MTIRREVRDFVSLGPLPHSDVDEETIRTHEVHLQRIERPVTDEEALVLLASFGPDDCYGLAWTLLHLIETAPSGAPLSVQPSDFDNEWLRRLWARAHR